MILSRFKDRLTKTTQDSSEESYYSTLIFAVASGFLLSKVMGWMKNQNNL